MREPTESYVSLAEKLEQAGYVSPTVPELTKACAAKEQDEDVKRYLAARDAYLSARAAPWRDFAYAIILAVVAGVVVGSLGAWLCFQAGKAVGQ